MLNHGKKNPPPKTLVLKTYSVQFTHITVRLYLCKRTVLVDLLLVFCILCHTVYAFKKLHVSKSAFSMLEPSFSEDQDIFVFFISFYNFDMIVSYFGHAGTFMGSSNLENFIGRKMTHKNIC